MQTTETADARAAGDHMTSALSVCSADYRAADAPAGAAALWTPIALAVPLLTAFAALTAIVARAYEADANQAALSIGCGLVVAALLAFARYGVGAAWLSVGAVYLMLFWTFHYGLAFTAICFPHLIDRQPYWTVAWLFTPNARLAMLLGVVGASGCVFGLALGGAGRARAAETRPEYEPTLYRYGCLLLVLGLVASAVVIFRNGGTGVFALGYLEFRAAMLGPTLLQTSVDLAQLGCLLALCGAGADRWKRPLAAFAPLAAVMMAVGLRMEAMVPLVSFAVILRSRGIRLPRTGIVIAIVAAVILIPVVREVRMTGIANEADADLGDVSPLETFTELGGTLRAAKAYIDWIDQGDEYLLGASYWAPFDRQLLTRLIPGHEQIPVEQDVRVPARDIATREGAVGESATGEAYYNFGPIGPFLFYGCVGLLFAGLDRWASTSAYASAVLGVAVFALYFNIRSGWLWVPAHIGLGIAVVAACYVARPREAVPAPLG
jgi:hypothetical protein